MKFLKVLTAVVILLTLVWSLIYFWGENQVYVLTPRVDWLTNQSKKYFVPCEEESAKSYGSYCDVHFRDSTFFVGDQPLAKILSTHPNKIFLLNFVENKADMDLKFKETLPAGQKLLLASDADVILRSLRLDFPNLPYGSSKADRLRLSIYTTLRFPRAYQVYFDFILSPLTEQGIQLLDQASIGEMRIRNLPIFLGPLKNQSELQRATELGADGFLLEDSKLLF